MVTTHLCFRPAFIQKHSLVSDIKDLLLALETAIRHHELHLVEGLGLVEVVAVGCANLVRVLVLLCFPGRTIPQLPTTGVATGLGVRLVRYLKLRAILKCLQVIAGAPDWVVMHFRVEEGVTHRCAVVVLGLEVASSFEHGTRTVPTTPGLHGEVHLRDQLGIESARETVSERKISKDLPSRGEHVLWLIDHLLLKDITGLLRHALADELVINLYTGNVPGVAWDHTALTSGRNLRYKRQLELSH